MSKIKCFRLYMKPDKQVPQFQRLGFEIQEVCITDVLCQGIHPWVKDPASPTLEKALIGRLNDDKHKLTELMEHGYCFNFHSGYSSSYSTQKSSHFERLLERIGEEVYFTNGLSYVQLMEMAKARLRARWSHRVARHLAERMHAGFPELRRFLKRKDRSLKLSGYANLDDYDLGRVLSLEDFAGQDGMIITSAFPRQNFRNRSFLESVTDGSGRLRLVSRIPFVTVKNVTVTPERVSLQWHVELKEDVLRFRPDIGKSAGKRKFARTFAKRWRTDGGELCFSTTLERLEAMMKQNVAIPSFPTLSYLCEPIGSRAVAELEAKPVQAFRVGAVPNAKWNGDRLKDVLAEYGVSRTGNKQVLLKKVAALAARTYAERKPELDAYFKRWRYVRVKDAVSPVQPLPPCEKKGWLENMVLCMYVLMHLRGNTILDSVHVNDCYTEGDLALALVRGDVALGGVFLRAG